MMRIGWLRILAWLVCLGAVALPPAVIRAQDAPGDEDRAALIEQVLAGIEALDQYQSYAVTSELGWHQSWTGGLNDQAMEGQSVEMARSESGTADLRGDSPVIQHMITVNSTETPLNTPPTSRELNALIIVIDGALYVKAWYPMPDASAPAVPGGWIMVEDSRAFQVWPGLGMVMTPQAYLGDPLPKTSFRLWGLRIEDLPPILEAYVTRATSAPIDLDDGTTGEAITLTLNRDGVRAAGIFFAPADPVQEVIYDNVTTDPLTITFVFDGQGRLIGQDLVFDLTLTDLDISAATGAPAGYRIDLTAGQSYGLRLSAINEPQELIEAPQIDTAALPAFAAPAPVGDLPWWNDRVFYEVFVRSFYDSGGDGIGDLRGLIEKLDYLNDGDPATTDDLGVTGLWLMPVNQSPSYHGYDVTDYTTIEEDYGTNQDFLDLMDAAHSRGMAVIVDLVLNHTSSAHPWFVASRAGDPEYADWYIWSDDPPDERGPWNQPVWYPAGDRAYFALFASGMPDLNYENPDVTAQMYDVIDFWLTDMGADGFRLDAIRHLDEDGPVMQNTPETLAWLDAFHQYVRSISPNALTVGEIWDRSAAVAPYVGDKVDIAFEFDFAKGILDAALLGSRTPLVRAYNTMLELYPTGQYASFLTNHDQNRVMSQLEGDAGAARVAATVLLTSPGVPFIYYGEEIGMVGMKPDERIRTPMQWGGSLATADFSTVMPWQRVQMDYKTDNVAAMDADPGSLLNHYRDLIRLRNEHAALRTGAMQLVATANQGVYSFLRYGEDETLLVVINLSRESITDYALSVDEGLLSGTLSADLLLGDGEIAAPVLNDGGGLSDYVALAELAPQSSYIIRLK